jgi:hypothetical protein
MVLQEFAEANPNTLARSTGTVDTATAAIGAHERQAWP